MSSKASTAKSGQKGAGKAAEAKSKAAEPKAKAKAAEHHDEQHDKPKLAPAELGEESKKKLVTMGYGIAGLGLVAAAAGYFADPKHFAFSYLAGFAWLTSIGLGGLFFVIIQHLTRAGWSVMPRRQAEWVSLVLPACAALFFPVAIFGHDLYHHWMSAEAKHDEILQKKASYLNVPFFTGRAVIFLVAWVGLSLYFWHTSRKQDETGDAKLTLKMGSFSAPAVLIFGLTLTFAAFDWLMSLDPHWYSTIFGVYFFAGAATSSLSVMALITIALQRAGLLKGMLTVEHQHDIGKLLFGFTVFWAYIAFSQFILIWYANIPEETIFYRHRWEGAWQPVSLLLLVGHFILPFLALLSRTAKRNATVLGAVAVWMLFMHWVDMYWLVLPTYDTHGHGPSWIDIAGLLGPLGVGALVLAMAASRSPLYPIRDPRLPESLKLENL